MTLVETVVALGLLVMAITTILLVVIAVGRQERDGSAAVDTQELLAAIASDLRLSLARADLAEAEVSSHFRLHPLPLAGRLDQGTVSKAYLRADWKRVEGPGEALPGLPVYELRMYAVTVPPPESLLPVRLRLEMWSTLGKPTEPLAVMPVSFAAP
jgi:hypothetical protein